MNTPNQWQLSGNAAERYERVLVPAIFAPWAADRYVKDRNLVIEYRLAEGKVERFPALAAELVALKVDPMKREVLRRTSWCAGRSAVR
jgi:hypothetical protein